MPKFISGSSGHIYAPDKLIKSEIAEQEEASILAAAQTDQRQDDTRKPVAINKKGTKEKQKNSLDLFKEELRRLAEEREAQRKKVKQSIGEEAEKESSNDSNKHKVQIPIPVPLKPDPRCPTALTLKVNLNPKDKESSLSGSFDNGDPTTTNLYVGNVNPTINENDLCDIFGKFGPLASIKIMWPRTDEERARNRNSGFVAYMSRVDAERALKALNGLEIRNYEMKLGWGKAVPLPQNPVYVPPDLMELLKPPPLSGLPFNAQLHEDDIRRGYTVPRPWPLQPLATSFASDDEYQRARAIYNDFTDVIGRSTVRIVIPQDRETLDRIHKTIEHVIREGPVFESIIMSREMNNPYYRYLNDNQSHEHVYYRWKLYSILHGDDPYEWRTDKFKMFEGGSFWLPPPLNPFAEGMPLDLIEKLTGVNKDILMTASDDNSIIHSKIRPSLGEAKLGLSQHDSRVKGSLGKAKSDTLVNILNNLGPSRASIGEAMMFCIDHADAAEEIINLIHASLVVLEISPQKKIARLFLVSDVLHNCSACVTNASYYRKGFHMKLLALFEHLHQYLFSLEDQQEAEKFKQKALSVLGAWKEWTLYEDDFIIELSNILLRNPSAQSNDKIEATAIMSPLLDPTTKSGFSHEDDLDGELLDENLLIKCLEAKGLSLRWYNALELSDDELDEDRQIDSAQHSDQRSTNEPSLPVKIDTPVDNYGSSTGEQVKFKTSKWETVDPSEVAEQVVRLSKWETKSSEV